MTVERLSEQPLNDDQELKLPTVSDVLAVLTAIAAIIGVRIGLILSLVGGFAIAWRVLEHSNPGANAVWTLALYLIVSIVPLALLNARRAS